MSKLCNYNLWRSLFVTDVNTNKAEHNIEMQSCGAYEVIRPRLGQQSHTDRGVSADDNPAYSIPAHHETVQDQQ